MYRQAAEMHAVHWCDKRLLQLSWLKGAAWFQGRGRDDWEAAINRARNDWKRVKTLHPSLELSAKLICVIDASLARASWKALQQHLSDPAVPFTLCHGDFHAANMFIKGNEAKAFEISQFDWSEVGPWEPVADLVQTLISDVKPDVFSHHSKDLVRVYWDRLIECGVDPKSYTFAQCWESFCRRGPERWVWVFCALAAFPGVPDVAVKYFHDQLLAFIEAHGDYDYYQLKPVVLAF